MSSEKSRELYTQLEAVLLKETYTLEEAKEAVDKLREVYFHRKAGEFLNVTPQKKEIIKYKNGRPYLCLEDDSNNRKPEKKLAVDLYDGNGRKRNPLEVLREVQAELQQPVIDGNTVVVDEREIEETRIKPEAEAMFPHAGWAVTESSNGNIEIVPMNADEIIIRGEEMLWFFICILLDCTK